MHHRIPLLLGLALLLSSCAFKDRDSLIRVSVADQKMLVFKKGVPVATYDVSTSKFGLGDGRGSRFTPLGRLEVAKKVGRGAPIGMKFKSRRPTGEIVAIDAPGRDPIVTRILWLKGLEPQNRNAYRRTIYIHGTAEERTIGKPASYGCIRMRSRDVVQLFDLVGEGARVEIIKDPLPVAMASNTPPGRSEPSPRQ
ncbi:MAG: L,D-transpeptidase [Chthoniobacteraceae bacterium]